MEGKLSSFRHRSFKVEFQGMRMITLTIKCYYAENAKSKPKFSCRGISKKQNPMSFERYLEAPNESINKAQNMGFRILRKGIITYNYEKLDLSAYYDKSIVAPDGIRTSPLR